MSVIQSKTPSLHKKLVKQFAFSLKNDLKTWVSCVSVIVHNLH